MDTRQKPLEKISEAQVDSIIRDIERLRAKLPPEHQSRVVITKRKTPEPDPEEPGVLVAASPSPSESA